MDIFLDSADVNDIRKWAETGLIHGVTTNPTLIAKSGQDIKKVIKEICGLVDGPVSAEVTAQDVEGMLREATVLRALADNVTIKVPLTVAGLTACERLTREDVMVNVTLCFSATQALMAANAGATFVSPFIGRLDDIGQNGMDLIAEIVQIYDNYELPTAVLAASIRHPQHVLEAALIGADVATMPAKVLEQLFQHPLTDAGLAAFTKDWAATGQKIA